MIHPPDVIKKYAPEAVLGKLQVGGPAPAAPAAGGAAPAAGGAAPAAQPQLSGLAAVSLANIAEWICCRTQGSFK